MRISILVLLFSLNAFASKFTYVTIANNQSMASSFVSTCVDMNQLESGSIQAAWTGASAAGSLTIQVSNYETNTCSTIPTASWSTYTGSAQTAAGPGNFLWNFVISGYRYVQLAFTFSSGTGSLGAVFVGKGN